jgi:hypothetical protein
MVDVGSIMETPALPLGCIWFNQFWLNWAIPELNFLLIGADIINKAEPSESAANETAALLLNSNEHPFNYIRF